MYVQPQERDDAQFRWLWVLILSQLKSGKFGAPTEIFNVVFRWKNMKAICNLRKSSSAYCTHNFVQIADLLQFLCVLNQIQLLTETQANSGIKLWEFEIQKEKRIQRNVKEKEEQLPTEQLEGIENAKWNRNDDGDRL